MIRRACIARELLDASAKIAADPAGYALCDLEIAGGSIARVSASAASSTDAPVFDARQGMLLPAFADCHVHLDKAYLAHRNPMPEGDLLASIVAMAATKPHWTEATLRKRVEFGLNAAFQHGVRAMRSHVDWGPQTPDFVAAVMTEIARDWRGKIELQYSSLTAIHQFEGEALRQGALKLARGNGGVIGFFLYLQPDLRARLADVFALAEANGFDLDFHVDEGLDPGLDGVRAVAEAALAQKFKGQILCGHCVALSLQDEALLKDTLAKVREANISVVSLPQTNLFLQGRNPGGTPRLRGIAPLNELRQAGIPVAIGCDNVRDGFFPYGDYDPVEALRLGLPMAHLVEARSWLSSITSTPAKIMRCGWDGAFREGAPADFVVFQARDAAELFSRSRDERIVVRNGKRVDSALPDFSALD